MATFNRRNFLLAAAGSPFARRLSSAEAPLAEAVRAGKLRAAVLMVATGRQRFTRAFGKAAPETVFLLASLTKPMTAAVLMRLVDEGKVTLDVPVSRHLPELEGERSAITLKQLLNHTSGLPDMPPDNLELRKRHAPLSEFLRSALTVPLRNPPGTEVHYQSMGFLVAALLAEKLVGQPFPEQMRRALFKPVGMRNASLGLSGRRTAATAQCQVPDDPGGWNSPYWRNLGSPWGGAHGNAADVTRLLRAFASGQAGTLSKASTAAMLAQHDPGERVGQRSLRARLAPGRGRPRLLRGNVRPHRRHRRHRLDGSPPRSQLRAAHDAAFGGVAGDVAGAGVGRRGRGAVNAGFYLSAPNWTRNRLTVFVVPGGGVARTHSLTRLVAATDVFA